MTARWIRSTRLGLWLIGGIFMGGFFSPPTLWAEYRAYWLEVFGVREKFRYEVLTGNLNPREYVYSHGGMGQLQASLKATWMCYGYTGGQTVCPPPKPLDPKFSLEQAVQVTLDKHTTYLWPGVIEVAIWREDLGSNVYGVRFPTMNNLYGIYFEKDLIAQTPGATPAPNPATPANAAGANPATINPSTTN